MRMKNTLRFSILAFMLLVVGSSMAATKTWSGAGDGLSWTDPANWSGGAVPVNGDDVTIHAVAGNPTIQLSGAVGNLQLNSLNSAEPLTVNGASLTVGSASSSSTITGTLTLTSGSLTITGAAATFTSSGPSSVPSPNLLVNGGATASFPGVTSYTQAQNIEVQWTASGNGSQLSFPNLATITGSIDTAGDNNAALSITAQSGGSVNLPALTSITVPSGTNTLYYNTFGVQLNAYDSGVLTAGALTAFNDNATDPGSSLTAYNSGQLVLPKLKAPFGVQSMNLNDLSTPQQFTSLAGTTSFQLNTGTVAMQVTDITNLATITVSQNGAQLSFPNVTAYAQPQNVDVQWAVSNAGCQLSFPKLASITGNIPTIDGLTAALGLIAENGGALNLPALTSITIRSGSNENYYGYISGGVQLTAFGSGVLTAAALTAFNDNTTNPQSSLTAYNSGQLALPRLTSPFGVPTIDLNDLSTPQQFTSMVGTISFQLNAGTVSMQLSSLATIANLLVSGTDASLSFPNMTSYTQPANMAVAWTANGSGCQLSFPNLTTIMGDVNTAAYTNGVFSITAENGGGVNLPALTTIAVPSGTNPIYSPNGIQLIAHDSGVLTAGALTTFNDHTTAPQSSLSAYNSGQIALPKLTTPFGVQMNLDELSTPQQFTSLKGTTSFQINAGTVAMQIADVSNLTTIAVSGNAQLSFPNVASYTQPVDAAVSWTANGSGCQLSFPNLTTITGVVNTGNGFGITAENGGAIDIPALTSITVPAGDSDGGIRLIAHDSGVLTAASLTAFDDHASLPASSLTAYNSGELALPQLTAPVGLVINLNDVSNPQQFTSLAGTTYLRINAGTVIMAVPSVSGQIVVEGPDTTVSFPQVTDLSGVTQITVDEDNTKLSFPNVKSYTQPANTAVSWTAGSSSVSNAGCELRLPALTTITGSGTANQFFDISAINGGEVGLSSVFQVVVPGSTPFEQVRMYSQDTGSLIDLSGINTSYSAWDAGLQLNPLNGGMILINPNGAYPDLVVPALTVSPATLLSGGQVTLQWQDLNSGLGAATGGWFDSINVVRTSDNAVVYSTSIFHDPAVEGTLASGGKIARSQSFHLPDGPAGAGNLRCEVMVDSTNLMVEYNSAGTAETNNTSTVAFSAGLNAYPDLQVQNLTVAPAAISSGTVVSVTWNAQNTGNAGVTVPFGDELVVRNKDTGETLFDQIIGANALGVIAPGHGRARQAMVSLPEGASGAGHLTFIVTTDATASVAEYNASGTGETNNVTSLSVQSKLASFADLIVTTVTVPAQAFPGQTVSIAWTVKNQGNANAPAPWIDQLFISGSNVVGGGSLVGASEDDVPLAAGKSVQRTASVTLPALAPGPAYIFVRTNATNLPFEGNLTNNVAVSNSPINIAAVLTLSLERNSISESDGPFMATVSRNGDPSNALAVTLGATPSGNLLLPPSVSIPAGAAAASFSIMPVSGIIGTGTQNVTVTAQAASYANGSAMVAVLDNISPSLSVSVTPSSVAEDAGGRAATGTVSRNNGTKGALTVLLTNGNTGAVTMPTSVVIPDGAVSATFSIGVIDDNIVTDTRTVPITASASGLTSGLATLNVTDADVPGLTLQITPTSVSESAANPAASGRITMVTPAASTVVFGLTSSDTTRVTVPATATVYPGAGSVTFPISVINKSSTGAASVTITATQLDNVLQQPITGESDQRTLQVYGTAGPTLTLSVNGSSLAPNQSLTGTVGRQSGTSGAVAVTLASSSSAISLPSSVTIPDGQASATFALRAGSGPLTAGTATITASANGFNSAALGLAIAANPLPDLVVECVTPSALTGLSGGSLNVAWMVSNDGSAPATGNWTDGVYFTRDGVTIGSPVATVPVAGPLAAGHGYHQSAAVTLPTVPGVYQVAVSADLQNSVAESSESNNLLVFSQAITVGPAYTVTVSTPITVSPCGTPVPLSGQATLTEGNTPAANVLVSVRVLVSGTRRVFTVMTDSAGQYQTIFQPLPTEAGDYTLAAAQPEVTADVPQAHFELIGLQANPMALTLNLAVNQPVSGTLYIGDLSNRPLSGITAQLTSAVPAGVGGGVVAPAANISATLQPPSSLAGNATGVLQYTITATDESITQLEVLFHVATAEGAVLDIPVQISVLPIGAQLVANPGTLERGMVRGTQTLVTCDLVNLGAAPTGDLSVELPGNFPWLSLASPAVIPSLAPGQHGSITVRLMPAANLPLDLYTGNIFVRAGQSGLTIPFQFRAISKAAGDVRVTVLDDYTYYVAGAPKVANATVRLRDAYDQSTIVAEGLTDENGVVTLPGVPEAPYVLEVTAPKHAVSRDAFSVVAGITNATTVFIARQVVTYTWQVVPTEIPDQYSIQLVATFETDVPIPLLTMQASPSNVIPDLQPGQSAQLNVTLTNQGLIAAQQVSLTVPGLSSGYQFTPLVTQLDEIAAKSSVTIPVIVQKTVAGAIHAAVANGALFAGGGAAARGDCTDFILATDSYLCGNRQYRETILPLVLSGTICVKSGSGFPAGPPGPPDPAMGSGSGFAPRPYVMAPSPCNPRAGQVFFNCVASFLPFGEAQQFGSEVFTCLQAGANSHPEIGCLVTPVRGVTGGKGEALLGCAAGAYQALVEALEMPGNSPSSGSQVVVARYTVSLRPDRAVAAVSPAFTAPGADSTLSLLNERISRLQDEVDAFTYILGDQVWLQAGTTVAGSAWMTAFQAAFGPNSDTPMTITPAETASLLAMPLPQNVTPTQAAALIDRFNETISNYAKGLFNSTDVAGGASANFIAYDLALQKLAQFNISYRAGLADGFSSPEAGVIDAIQRLQNQPPVQTQGTCATVLLQIDQQAVLTRAVFSGTLSITNGNSTGALSGMSVTINILDATGAPANDRFFVEPPVLTGLKSVTGSGSLAAGATGEVQYTFIPTTEAAITAPTRYTFTGTLQYSDNGQTVSVPLSGSPVTVYPDARLRLKYFEQRDVYSDDPFTPRIEPAEPFSLGLLVTNVGGGVASNFSITSAQPKIIDYRKGLLADFKIIGTEVGDQMVAPSLTVDLGNIAPGGSQVAQFILTSSIQGRFTEYDATFQHSNALGGTSTSLIDSVEIHELIHVVQADRPGDDDLPDFLVNDVPDPASLPDTLYQSDGTVAPVNLGTNVTTTIGTFQGTLSASMPTGWCYLEVADPGAGLKLAKVVRSDGKVMLVGPNVWQTDRTFPNTTTGSVDQPLLHLFDFNGTGSYTLFYTIATPVNYLATPVRITQLGPVTPAVRTSPVNTVNVTVSAPIDPSTFSGADVTLSLNGGSNLIIGSSVTVAEVNETTYAISGLAGFNAAEGTYVLTVQAGTITDVSGNPGQGAATAIWALSTSHVAVVSAGGFGGETIRGPVATIDVVFSEAVDHASFNLADLKLTRNGGANLLTSANSITQTSPTSFRVGGLSNVTKPDGSYAFTVSAGSVTDANGVAGVGSLTENFTIDTTGPAIASLDAVTPNPRNSPVSSLALTFSKPIVPASFDLTALKLTLNGKTASLGTSQIIALDDTHFEIEGLAAATGFVGTYAFTVSAKGVRDSLGNSGAGSISRTWTVVTKQPAAPSNLKITPDNGLSAHDHVTNTLAISVTGTVAAGTTHVRISDSTAGTTLAQAAVATSNFRIPLQLNAAGVHQLTVQALDAVGNLSIASPLSIFIDLSHPTVKLPPVSPTPRQMPVASVTATFSEPLRPATFTRAAISLTRDGVSVPVSGVRIQSGAPGTYTIDGLTALTTKPGVYTLSVSAAGVENVAGSKGQGIATTTWRMQSGSNFEQFSSFAGNYQGLILADPPGHTTSGIVSIVLDRTASLTAKGILGGVPYTLLGKLDNSGKFTGSTGKGSAALTISLTLETEEGADAIVGTVTGSAGQSSFLADRLIYSTSAPTPLAGKYAVLFPPTDPGSTAGAPVGEGFGVLTLAPNGALTVAGQLADGTKFSQSTALGGEDEWPFYVSMDGGKSSAVAQVTFRNMPGVSDLDGLMSWYRASRAQSAPFPAAFTTSVSIIGSAYGAPKAGQPVFDFGNVGQKAELVLSGGGINPDLVLPFTFDTKGHALFSNPGRLHPSLTLSLADGLVTGSVQVPGDATPISFSGVAFPRQMEGYGFFIRLSSGGLIELKSAQ